MATPHSTLKGRAGRSGPAIHRAGRRPTRNRPPISENTLPVPLLNAIEDQRMVLGVALSLLTALDATLERQESGGGDLLDDQVAADASVLQARAIARPVHILRLAIQRVYEAQAALDSVRLERTATG